MLSDILCKFGVRRQCKQHNGIMKQKITFQIITHLHGAWFFILMCIILLNHINILKYITFMHSLIFFNKMQLYLTVMPEKA